MVHVRFIVTVLSTNEVREQVVKTFMRLLKPGGYLQWTEPVMPFFSKVDSDEQGGLHTEREWPELFRLMDKYCSLFSGREWVGSIDELIKRAGGCHDVNTHQIGYKKSLLKYETDLLRWNRMEMSETLIESEEGKKEVLEAHEKFHRDLDDGYVVASQQVILVARKS